MPYSGSVSLVRCANLSRTLCKIWRQLASLSSQSIFHQDGMWKKAMSTTNFSRQTLWYRWLPLNWEFSNSKVAISLEVDLYRRLWPRNSNCRYRSILKATKLCKSNSNYLKVDCDSLWQTVYKSKLAIKLMMILRNVIIVVVLNTVVLETDG